MPNETKKTVAVIFGGKSAEHDVSIITGHIPIIAALRAVGVYTVVPIYIGKDGQWYSDERMNDLAYFKQADFAERVTRQKPVQLSFAGGFSIVHPGLFPKRTKIDVVFPAMHGTYGEDGSLMGLLRMAHVPFVGCDLFASAVAMDKVLTKQVIAAEGVPVTPYVWFTRRDWQEKQTELLGKIRALHFPLFVKPVHLGSSIGIGKVRSEAELLQATEVAFHYDSKVLVEEGVEDLIEVTLPIMGNDTVRLAGIEHPLNKTEFFDFKDKYLSAGGKKSEGGANNAYSEIPAKISPELSREVAELGEKVYKTLGCSGIARVDFLIDEKKGKVYVNEVNTLPGSLYAHNWKQVGVSNIELVERLIALAQERFAAEEKLTHTFESSILERIGGAKTQ